MKGRVAAGSIRAGLALAPFDDERNRFIFRIQTPKSAAYTLTWGEQTRQIKMLVHGPEGATDPEATFALTEKVRAPLEKAILDAKQPAEHVITVAAVK